MAELFGAKRKLSEFSWGSPRESSTSFRLSHPEKGESLWSDQQDFKENNRPWGWTHLAHHCFFCLISRRITLSHPIPLPENCLMSTMGAQCMSLAPPLLLHKLEDGSAIGLETPKGINSSLEGLHPRHGKYGERLAHCWLAREKATN